MTESSYNLVCPRCGLGQQGLGLAGSTVALVDHVLAEHSLGPFGTEVWIRRPVYEAVLQAYDTVRRGLTIVAEGAPQTASSAERGMARVVVEAAEKIATANGPLPGRVIDLQGRT